MNTKFPTAQLPENADLLDVLMAYGLSFSEGQAVRHIVDGDLVAAVEILQRHIQYEAQLKLAPVPADTPKAFVPEPVTVAEPEPEPVAEPEPEAAPAPSKVTSALAQRILSRGGGLTVAQELAMPAAWLSSLGQTIDPPGAWPTNVQEATRAGISVLSSMADASPSTAEFMVVRPDGSSASLDREHLADLLADPQGHWVIDV
jgi:hypothetical protein